MHPTCVSGGSSILEGGGRQEEIGKKLFSVDNVITPKARRCVARRGVRGHAPLENFHNFNAKWCTLEAF